jgi:hypothetical protein
MKSLQAQEDEISLDREIKEFNPFVGKRLSQPKCQKNISINKFEKYKAVMALYQHKLTDFDS